MDQVVDIAVAEGADVVEVARWRVVVRTASGLVVELERDVAGVLEPGRTAAAVAACWPRGTWDLTFRGRAVPLEAPMPVRHDPLLTAAMTALAAAKQARLRDEDGGVRATVTDVASRAPFPGASTGEVDAQLDVRAATVAVRDAYLDALLAQARSRADRDGTRLDVEAVALVDEVVLDPAAVASLTTALGAGALTTPAGDGAAAATLRGERAAALVLASDDPGPIRTALRALR